MDRIYTRRGDDGTTGLLGPGRFPKSDRRIAAYGEIDELNATIGVARAIEDLGTPYDNMLARVQAELFNVGAALADPDPNGPFHRSLPQDCVDRLEREIDSMQSKLKPLEQFILPGGSRGSAQLHFSRAVCRRAERALVSLSRLDGESVPESLIGYVNRLSDYLFVMARAVNHEQGVADVPWRG